MSEPLLEEEVFVFPASFAQARLWFIDQLVPGNAFYNVLTALRLSGSLNLSALEQTFKEIVRRHEILRTRFAIIEGELVQAIAPVTSLKISLPVIDLRGLQASERSSYSRQLVTEESQLPFNLATGPLIRLTLLQLDETEYILLLNLHHIVSDDWSIGVLIRELKAIYSAFALGKPSPLPELPLQYADFAHWQRDWLQGVAAFPESPLQKQLAYWRQQLEGVSSLNLPTDRPKPASPSYRGATQFLEYPKSLSEALKTRSQQEGVTLFMTLLTAFQILLYRYTQQEDITVGTPIANRNRSEIEPLIGFFVNSLVLRTDLSGNPTFRELLNRVKEVTLGAYAHQDLPFEKLVEELHPERILNRHPLFQVIFALQNAPMEALELPGLRLSSMNIDYKTTRFDLEFHVWESSDSFRGLWGEKWENAEGLRGVVVYNTDLFDEATIARMSGHFKTLLEGIVANPEIRISDLPLLSPTERHQVLVEWNNTIADYPKDLGIHQLFEQQVARDSNTLAITYENQHITYRELNNRSNQLAHYLQKIGVSSDTLVGICMEPSIEMIVAMLGILKAGGAYVPLDPSYPSERLNFMIEDAQVVVLLTNYSLLAQHSLFSHPVVVCLDKDWGIIAQQSQKNLSSNVTINSLAYVIFTSGSTGKPKGVAIPHKAVNRLVFNTNYIKLNSSDKIAQVSNTSFDAATFEIWGALLHGAQLVGISRDVTLSPQDFAQQLRQKGISIMFLTTALFQQMARTVPQAFTSLRYLLFGGEAVDSRWVEKVLKNKPPQHLIHVYGPTESTTFSSYYEVQDVPEAKSIPIGRPITNTQIYILDQHLQPVPIGVPGELYIGGEGLAQCYLNRPELTARQFIISPQFIRSERLYKTGDLATLRADGNIEFIGRIDEQVKIRGFRIELGEIEAVLNQFPAVEETVVTIWEEVPDEKHLVAYVVPTLSDTPTSKNLRQFLKEKLPSYMIPSVFVLLESLPLTPNGKVDRRALKVPNNVNFSNQEDYVAPRTGVEELLIEIWVSVLGKQPIGVHDNFFELGGHSLLATQLTSRIRDACKMELPVRQLFESPTVASLARYIETISWAANSQKITTENNQREEAEF